MNTANVANRLDRIPISSIHRTALFILSFAYFFDFFDLNTFSYAAAALVKEWHISTKDIAFITSASYFAMFIGCAYGGWFSDRFGRKKALVTSVVVFSVFSLLSILAWNPISLAVFRFLTSLGVASTTVIASTYISEFFPSKAKGKYQAYCVAIGICGIPVAGWVAQWVIPMYSWGWKMVFVAGAIGIFYPLWVRKLEESPRWYEARGEIGQANEVMKRIEEKVMKEKGALPQPKPMEFVKHSQSKSISYTDLFKKPLLGRTIVLTILWIMATIGIQGFTNWGPTLLVKQGISLDKSIAYFTLSTLGSPLGALIASPWADRFDRKKSIAIVSFIIVALCLIYGWSPVPMVIIVGGFLINLFQHVHGPLSYLYVPESYPVEARGKGNGFAYGVGRLSNIIAPFIVSSLYSGYGFFSVFMFYSACWLICGVVVGIFGLSTLNKNVKKDGVLAQNIN
jgi:MFS transporter, putative metabolite:H+ symporter